MVKELLKMAGVSAATYAIMRSGEYVVSAVRAKRRETKAKEEAETTSEKKKK
jgi:hypothetical protein